MSSILIVPGLFGSGEYHWQTYWERHLPHTVRVQQDDWRVPDLERWSAQVIAAACGRKNIWIVAHSFGVLATVYALHEIAGQVEGVFLVAPADPQKFGLQHVLPKQVPPVKGALVASHTDPWLPWSSALEMADNWLLPVLDAGDAGHINVVSGYCVWRQGLHWFESLRLSKLDAQKTPSLVSREPLNTVLGLDASNDSDRSTPVNWKSGDDCIIVPSVSDEDAKSKFPGGWKTIKPYLRIVPQPK